MKFTIREMIPADYDNAYRLWQTSEGIGLSDADSSEAIRAYLERNPGMSFVGELDGRVIGTVLGGHDGRRGYLHHLAVAGEHRGKGIGRKLVETCLAKLAEDGIQRCHGFVRASNEAGKSFWQKMGWLERNDLVMMSKETRK